MKTYGNVNRRITDKELKAWDGWKEPEWELPNFTMDEVRCPCCGRQNMSFGTISKFQKARNGLEMPIYGNSWCRCAVHNNEVGGMWNSSHVITPRLLCRAGDVTLLSRRESLLRIERGMPGMTAHEFYRLWDALKQAGFTRFGLSTEFLYIHADDDGVKDPETIWFYK